MREVGEGIAGIPPLSPGVREPASVGVDESTQQEVGYATDMALLPVCKSDRAKVLLPWPVLRKETGPALRVRIDLDVAVWTDPRVRLAHRNDIAERHDRFADDPWVLGIEKQPKPEHPAGV